MSDETGFRKCDESSCEFPATHYMVWTEPQCYCLIHAQQRLALADAIGHPTPRSTVRKMTIQEMFVDDKTEDDHE